MKLCRNVHLIRTHRLVTLSVPLKRGPLLWLSPKDLQVPPSLCPEGLQPPFGNFCHLLDILVASKSFKNGQNFHLLRFITEPPGGQFQNRARQTVQHDLEVIHTEFHPNLATFKTTSVEKTGERRVTPCKVRVASQPLRGGLRPQGGGRFATPFS